MVAVVFIVKVSWVGIPEFRGGTNVSGGSNASDSDVGDWYVRVSNYITFQLCIKKKYVQVESKQMREAQMQKTQTIQFLNSAYLG